MDEQAMTALAEEAIGIARSAWAGANGGQPSGPMAQAAAIPAIGIITASILSRNPEDDGEVSELARQAILIARRAWERSGETTPANPMARTAEKAAIGIIAAGILSRL